MQQCYLVTYDISDPKRLREVFRVMKGYGEHLQYSVFRCELSEMSLARLKDKLSAAIDMHEDQVLFIDLGPVDGRARGAIESMGRRWIRGTSGAVIV